MGLTVTLAGQDISDFVDESSISIESVLGQSAGSGSEPGGQSTTADFLVDLGPASTAKGAGQSRQLTYLEQVLNDSPAAAWRMDNATATPDASGHAKDGVVQNGPLVLAKGATGDRNLAWATNGTAYVRAPLVTALSTGVSMECLVFLNSSSDHGPLICNGDWDTGIAIGIGGATDWTQSGARFYAKVGTTFKYPGSPIVLPTGVWTHLRASITGGTIYYYVNGVLQGSASAGGNVGTNYTYLGATSNGWVATGLLLDEPVIYTSVPTDGRFSAHYAAISVSPSLVRQGEVIIKDATNTTIFGGYATIFDDASLPTTVKTHISCHDYTQDLERIEVNEVYIGRDDVYIMKDILTKYASWIVQTSLPASGTFTFDKRYVRAKSVKDALQQLADVTGFAWWITPDKVIHYIDPDTASSAPFALSDTPDNVTTYPHKLTAYQVDDTGIINRVYFYGGKVVSADFTQDLSVQSNGTNKVYSLAYFPHDSSDGHIHVKKAGVDLVLGSPFDTGSTGKLISDGGTADVLLNRDAETLTFDTAPAAGVALVCIYRYQTPTVVVVSDTASFNFYGRWYDGKLDDQNVFDTTTAIQRSRVLLAEQNYGLVSASVLCWQPGLQAGQILSLTNALRGLNNVTYLVQKVTVIPLGGGQFEYQVDLGAWNWNLVDLLFAAAHRAGVHDDSTEENQSVVQAQQFAQSLTVHPSTTLTSRTSGVYYSRTSAVGDGHDAYSGFFTITS